MREAIIVPLRVVVHEGYGCYGLTPKAVERLIQLGTFTKEQIEDAKRRSRPGDWKNACHHLAGIVPRHHPNLIQVVEEMGEAAGEHLVIKEIALPYEIRSYDGAETLYVNGREV